MKNFLPDQWRRRQIESGGGGATLKKNLKKQTKG